MIRRCEVAYTEISIESMRVSAEIFDYDTAPGSPRRRAGRNANPRSGPADGLAFTRRGALAGQPNGGTDHDD